MKQRVLFASTNHGKIDEFKRLIKLDPRRFELLGLRDLSYTMPVCEETGNTFKQNAELKARHTREHLVPECSDVIIIADDSGMSLQALGGKPGVYTRRWIGREMADEEIINYCLDQLHGKDRTADYITAFAILLPNDSEVHFIEGHTQGVILDAPREESYATGIPFRSLFFIPELGMMLHEARELSLSKRKGVHIGHEEALNKCRTLITEYAS